MHRIRNALFFRHANARLTAARRVAQLPAYQIALWPDGWVLELGGRVRVCDTHAMAEARRWYALAGASPSRGSARVMALHGVFVPRVIVDLSNRRFPTEQAASVAVQLVAGDWVRRRRAQLLCEPERALRERALAWRGSQHLPDSDAYEIAEVLQALLAVCVRERLIPNARYEIDVRSDAGFGLCSHRCTVKVGLDRHACEQVAEVLRAGLVPWNRAVVRDGMGVPLIVLAVSAP